MGLDVRRKYHGGKMWLRVRVKIGTRVWVLVQDQPIDVPHTRAARRQILRTYADLASIKLGHPYRLRSKLR